MDEKNIHSGHSSQPGEDENAGPKTEISQEAILAAIDNDFNRLEEEEDLPQDKKSRFMESDPLITKIENFINERYELRMDEVRNVLEVKRKWNDDGFKKDERFEANLTVELLREGFKGVKNAVSILLASDFVKSYHPVRSYFEHLVPWDGVDRYSILSACLVTTIGDHQAILRHHLKKHLLRCIVAVYQPGFFNKHCFVLIGTGQSMGKTTFIRNLVPEVLKPYITDAVLEWKDKDANIALGSNWIINLDELANLNRDETNSLKATLSRNTIKVRRPYDRIESEIPRLANFFGSTNDLQFLTDLTGNVRWICFRIADIDRSYNELDLDQLWAQIYHDYKNGENYDLDKDELNENDKRNEAFMVSNPEVEAIQRYLMPGVKDVKNEKFGLPLFSSPSDLMKLINEKGYHFRSDKKFGQALQKCGFHRTSERDKVKLYSAYGYWYYEVESEPIVNDAQ